MVEQNIPPFLLKKVQAQAKNKNREITEAEFLRSEQREKILEQMEQTNGEES